MPELYLADCYIKEFNATVTGITDKDDGNQFVVLDQTAFYPKAGGQPHDIGAMIKDEQEYPVIYVGKFDGIISHEISGGGLTAGDNVTCKIDWERRYRFMRHHTACHVLSAVIHKETGAKITGNQIGEDKTRVDFSLDDFDRELIKSYETKVNTLVDSHIPVNISFLSRQRAMEIPSLVKLAAGLSEDIENVRIIDIVDYDMQACGGTHVANTDEIGHIEIIKAENKGKSNRRIYFRLL
ncbi:MAG: alanyl-tRNA editing protein [Methanosarcinales archaeon]|nr:alanyl-tRNA editing protein [Methanosarcinales archaeon]